MTDHDILLAIHELLDGTESWSPDTLDEIAQLLTSNGYHIRDISDRDHEQDCLCLA